MTDRLRIVLAQLNPVVGDISGNADKARDVRAKAAEADAEQGIHVFYDQNNNLTTDPTLGRSVDITIELEDESFGRTVNATNNIRMTLRNPT